MKIKLDKLKLKIKSNNKIIIFLLSLIILGIISGTIFSLIINSNDKSKVNEYITDFLMSIKNCKLLFIDVFKNSIIDNFLTTLIIWTLGISIIGVPIIIFLFFSKAFVVGFTIGSIIINYRINGCLLALIYLFPHQIINMLLYTTLMLYSLALSIRLIFVLIKRKSIDFKPIINKYAIILVVCLLGFTISALYEAFIMPKLIKSILSILKV